MSYCVRAAVLGFRAGIAILSSRRPCRFHLGIMLFRADAATRRFISQDRELCAGAMLRLAGCSSGRRDCARGGRSAERAVLLECLAFGLRLPYSSVGMSGVRFTPVSFPLSGKERRLAVCSVPIPPWVEIALRAFSNCPYGYRALWVHFGFSRFFVAIPTENGGDGENAETTRGRSRRRCVSAFLRKHIGFAMFSAGSTLGLRAPDCAKESSTLWTLFTLRRGCLGA